MNTSRNHSIQAPPCDIYVHRHIRIRVLEISYKPYVCDLVCLRKLGVVVEDGGTRTSTRTYFTFVYIDFCLTTELQRLRVFIRSWSSRELLANSSISSAQVGQLELTWPMCTPRPVLRHWFMQGLMLTLYSSPARLRPWPVPSWIVNFLLSQPFHMTWAVVLLYRSSMTFQNSGDTPFLFGVLCVADCLSECQCCKQWGHTMK